MERDSVRQRSSTGAVGGSQGSHEELSEEAIRRLTQMNGFGIKVATLYCLEGPIKAHRDYEKGFGGKSDRGMTVRASKNKGQRLKKRQ
ncbi:unnamed protein product [Sphenostylis stenocarpa]|uniref:Uncharacterized protein n=1 Tax=Sphenostylis stenocarpa TaxID=92480 RepID=A0AA86SMS2_9FABA|nr:unnamed protein product [Sphenostylis stenocarpa]